MMIYRFSLVCCVVWFFGSCSVTPVYPPTDCSKEVIGKYIKPTFYEEYKIQYEIKKAKNIYIDKCDMITKI